jgi:hypothetical protein
LGLFGFSKFAKGVGMCRSCQSGNQVELPSEINIHFPGISNLDKPRVLIFPSILVCLDCGFSEFVIGESELRKMVTS